MLDAQQLVANALKIIKEISVTELAQLLKNKNINLLEIREPEEVALGVIPGSVWITRGVLEFQILSLASQLHWNPADEIYITCRSGNRSALAAVALLEMGFKKSISVAGGFNAWKEAGLPITQDILHF